MATTAELQAAETLVANAQAELKRLQDAESATYKEQRQISSQLRDIAAKLQDPNVSAAEKDALEARGVALESQYNQLEQQGRTLNNQVQQQQSEVRSAEINLRELQQQAVATESAGQTTVEAQKANTEGADTQRPDPAAQVASADGTVGPASTSTATTAEPSDSGRVTTGTDGRLRTYQDVQSSPSSTPEEPSSADDSANVYIVGAPNANVGYTTGDDAGGLNVVARYIESMYSSALNVTPRDNPLDKFPSYTYNLSVYMMTPQQYNAMLSAPKPSVAGLLLLMNSGGVPTSERNQYFPLDYYMDTLQIKTYVSGKGAMGAHTATELSFRITEPNGLTFIHNLVKATTALALGENRIENSFLNQHYLMAIRFQAMDANGALVNAPSLGGTSSNPGIIEKFIPFRITGIRTKVASRVAEYEISAVCPQNQVATGQQRGTIPYNIELQSMTLKDRMVELCTALNKFQVDLTKPQAGETESIFEYADEYDIKLLPPLDDPSVTVIPPGEISRPATGMNPDPKTAPPNQTLNPATQTTKTTVKPMSASAGLSIVQFIDQAVRTSGYIYQQQNKFFDPKTKKIVTQNGSGKYLAWYRITTEARPMADKWDRKRRDYAYKVTYQVAPYLVTDSLSEYFPVSPKWPAPKIYYYWFTGQNTQILDYTQELNNLYYLVVTSAQRSVHLDSLLRDETAKGFQATSGQSSQGSDGKVNEPGANAADRFYSPADLARIKMTIVGDPDWIAQGDVWGKITPVIPDATLPDGTINFASREPLFEVVYNTPADYDLNQGIIKPPAPGASPDDPLPRREIISNRYLAYWVVNNFDKGKFTQELNGTLVFPHQSRVTQQNAAGQSGTGTPMSTTPMNQRTLEAASAAGYGGERKPTSALQSTPGVDFSGSEFGAYVGDGTTGGEVNYQSTGGVNPINDTAGTTSSDPPPTVAPQPEPAPPTSNGQDVSIPQTTPQPSPSTGYVTSVPDGVTRDPNSGAYSYEGQNIVAGTNDALSAQVTAIRTGNQITYQDYDRNSGWVTKTYDPQTKTYNIIGDAPNPYGNQATSASSQTMAKDY